MSKVNDGPAFPTDAYYDEKRYGVHDGMTLRDYFAAKALQAEIITTCSDATPQAAENAITAASQAGIGITDHLARNAYRWADAMLKARAG